MLNIIFNHEFQIFVILNSQSSWLGISEQFDVQWIDSLVASKKFDEHRWETGPF